MRFRRSFLLLTALVAALASGCAASEDSASDSSSALAEPSRNDIAGAFSVDYGLGALGSGKFVDLDDPLEEKLPEGAARQYAQCLSVRRDIVKGSTLVGKTWEYEKALHYVLDVEVEDSPDIKDARLLFVFSSTGDAEFLVLAWEGRRNLKIYFDRSPPCV